MTNQNERHIEDFFDGIAPFQDAYEHTSFGYLAVRHGDGFVLVQGRIQMQPRATELRYGHFASENVRAGRYRLSELGCGDARQVLARLRKGVLSTPDGKLTFPSNEHGTVATQYLPFHSEGLLREQSRWDVLTLEGATRKRYLREPHFDWEVRAAATPYDSLADLANEYALGPLANDRAVVDCVAFSVIAINNAASTIVGERATIGLILALGLRREHARLGYQVFNQGRIVRRGQCEQANMRWEGRDGVHYATAEVSVPEGSVLHCYASYAGIAQHHWWIVDPATAQNPRRAVYEAFDSRLEILTSFFTSPHPRQGAADLEAGVAWLAWMMGFSVASLGRTQRTRDAPDLVAVTPNGDTAVIECTTGLLKTDNKLPKLVARAETVRARLRASGNSHQRVLPVIATSMTREEIKADLEQAEKLGVGVLAREDLLEALNRTVLLRNAQLVFDEGEKNVSELRAKHEARALAGASGNSAS